MYSIKSLPNLLLSSFISILFSAVSIFAQSNDQCLSCHSDNDITMEKNGRTIKLTVKKHEIAKSVHSKLLCVNCHTGFNADDIPHKTGKMEVNCIDCHSNPKSKHMWHPSMARANGTKNSSPDVNCANCHGYHKIVSPGDPSSPMNIANSTEFCGKCHVNEKKDHIQSEHFSQANAHNPNSPNCIFCHKNPITKGWNVQTSKLKINQERLCLSCHIHNASLESQYSKSLVNYENSVHGKAILKGNQNAAVCVDCHGTHKLQKSTKPDSWIHQFNVPNVCGKCHDKVSTEYMASIHGQALKNKNKDVPGCSYCHGEHNVQQVPDVPHEVFSKTGMKFNVIVDNKMVFCVACHSDEKLMSKYKLATIEKAHQWIPSQKVHWETVRCVDCHSSHQPPNLSHNILPPDRTVKKCEECHAMNSILMTTLYRHEKQLSREKYGFINGTILSDAYVIGTTRNVYLNAISIGIFILTLAGIFTHATLRFVSSRKRRK